MKRRIHDHPLLAFVLLAFGFSYLAGGPALFAVQAWLPHAPELVRTYLGRLFVVAGPAVAALTVTGAA